MWSFTPESRSHIWDLLLVEQVMTLGIPEVNFSSNEWLDWVWINAIIWLKLEPKIGFTEGIKLACWSKHTKWSYFSWAKLETWGSCWFTSGDGL